MLCKEGGERGGNIEKEMNNIEIEKFFWNNLLI